MERDVRENRQWSDYFGKIPFLGQFLDGRDKVAVIRLSGVIADGAFMRRAGISAKKYEKVIEEAFSVPHVRAVALVINSPGGSPAQCSLIATKILKESVDKSIPVFAFVEDVAASGGYWLACIGEEIYAQSTSIVGSIGVVSSGFGFEDFIEQHGIHRRIYTSGTQKSFLDPFKPEKADDLERLKVIQTEIHEAFRQWVRARRGERLAEDKDGEDLMQGAFWTGERALDLGLIDGIGTVGAVMEDKFGEDVRLVEISAERKGLLASLLPFDSEGRLSGAGIDLGSLWDVAEERALWSRFGF